MRSATRHALNAVKQQIDTVTQADANSVRSLFDAVDTLAESKPLLAALSESGANPDAKRALVERVFGSQLGEAGARILGTVATQSWASEDEFLRVLQEAAIRAIAQATGAHEQLGSELDAFNQTVQSDGELELSLGSRLGAAPAKLALVNRLFGHRLSADTLRILTSLVTHPGGRRTRKLVGSAREAIADQANRSVAVVTVAKPISEEQVARLRSGLTARFGRDITVNQIIDPAVIGGMRIEIGDVVIDDTAAARLHDLRMQLA